MLSSQKGGAHRARDRAGSGALEPGSARPWRSQRPPAGKSKFPVVFPASQGMRGCRSEPPQVALQVMVYVVTCAASDAARRTNPD